MFLNVLSDNLISNRIIHNKKMALSYLTCKKNIFSLSPNNSKKKKICKINQCQYDVINCDNMLQMRNTDDLQNLFGVAYHL